MLSAAIARRLRIRAATAWELKQKARTPKERLAMEKLAARRIEQTEDGTSEPD